MRPCPVGQRGGMTLASVVAAAFGDALTFWLPVSCAGCDALDVSLCSGCRDALAPRCTRRPLAPGLTVTSALPFDGVVARTIRALKEDGRTGLAGKLAPALDAALRSATPAGAQVTSVPGSRAAFRRRGYRPVDLLVARAGWRTQRLLHLQRSTLDQRGLGLHARRRNLEGALRARPVTGTVVVVDDVVTTGATLVEAARALRAAGADRVIAVTLAATPRHHGDAG